MYAGKVCWRGLLEKPAQDPLERASSTVVRPGLAYYAYHNMRTHIYSPYPEMDPREFAPDACPAKYTSGTDCKSLYDGITEEWISMAGRRLSLEASPLRQSLKEVSVM